MSIDDFGYMEWKGRPIHFDVRELGFDPHTDTKAAMGKLRQIENDTRDNDNLENKLLAVAWHKRSFVNPADRKRKATFAGMRDWLWGEYDIDIRPQHLRSRILIVDIFVPCGRDAEDWIEQFPLSTAGLLAELTRLVLARRFDGRLPLQMEDDDLAAATKIVRQVMAINPPAGTSYRDVQSNFTDNGLLQIDDVPGYKDRPKSPDGIDIDEEIFKRLRNCESGMIGSGSRQMFLLEDVLNLSQRLEQGDCDYVNSYCAATGLTRGGLRRLMLDEFRKTHPVPETAETVE